MSTKGEGVETLVMDDQMVNIATWVVVTVERGSIRWCLQLGFGQREEDDDAVIFGQRKRRTNEGGLGVFCVRDLERV